MKRFFPIATWVLSLLPTGYAAGTVPVIVDMKVQTEVPAQPEIQFFLRLPEGHTAKTPIAKGVVAFCTWQHTGKALVNNLLNENDPLIQYAKRRKLAILTWNTATLWQTGKSFEQLSQPERQAEDRNFDAIARAWARGARQLCKAQNLPQSGFLLYGISRGAHWSGRLALRLPELFLAVHIHVANSYDKVTASSVGPLWFVSSGELDPGRFNAVMFYRQCQAKGFPIVLKVPNGLGHAPSSEVNILRDVFFDYALECALRAGKEPPAVVMLEDLERSEILGDLLSQEVYRGEARRAVPPAQRVPLPDENFARAWSRPGRN